MLEGTPERALSFLRAVSTKVGIRAALMEVGYSEEEQETGWLLLLDATGQRPEALPKADDEATRAAIAEIDAWDEQGFRRIGAALGRLHPEQNAFVFEGLAAQRGAGSLLSVATLLDRLDALEAGPAREATREADQAALATLERRGIDKAMRSHLRSLLANAQRATEPDPVPDTPMGEAREQALRALRAWYLDWSETARAVIHRRDYLIMLGLTKRRRHQTADDDASEADTPAGTPVDTPTVIATVNPSAASDASAPGEPTGAPAALTSPANAASQRPGEPRP